LFEREACLDDLRIFFQGPGKGGIESDRVCIQSMRPERRKRKKKTGENAERPTPNAERRIQKQQRW
jgi:hypothetical protein